MSVRQHRAARIAAATKELACWTTCVKMETKEFATITDPAAEERSYQELRLLARQFKSLRQPAEEECKVLGQLLNSLSWNERRRNNLQAACGNAAEAAHVFTSLIRSAAEPKLYVQHLADATQCWASHLDACGDLSSLKLWRQAQYLHCASGTHCKNQANQAKTHADEIERGSLLLPPTAPPPTVFVLVPLPPPIGGMQPLLAQHAAVQLGAHALAPAVNLNVAMPPVAPLPLAPVPPPPAGMLGAPMPQLAANMVPQAPLAIVGPPAPLPEHLMDWLAARRLTQFAQDLAALGVQDMRDMKDDVTDDDLRNMGMKELHIRRYRA